MQEFASRKESSSAPPAGHWPSDEELAAYIDGRLGKTESQHITEHLADCEECYAVYAETLQFQLESEPLEGGNVVAFPSKEGMERRWWYRIAALLAIGIGIGGAYSAFLAPPPDLVTAEMAASVQGKTGLVEKFWLGRTERGGGDGEGEGVPIDQAAFRVGVQLVNLQVSLEAGDAEAATNVVAYILQALDGQIYIGGLDEAYKKEITDAIVNGTPPRNLLDEASRLATESREILGPLDVDFGQWVEAGHLAAAAEQPSFFQRGETRAFLRRLLWRDKLRWGEMKLDQPSRESLQEISRILDKGDLQTPDYEALRGRIDEILKIQYPES